MKQFLRFSIYFLILSGSLAFSQNKKGIPGTPSNCNLHNLKGTPLGVQNGSQAIITNYTATACGLDYTYGSVVLGQRSPVGGAVQPANITISGIPACATI